MYLVKTKSGQFIPLDSDDHDQCSKIAPGDVVKCSKPRNYQFHKKAFALINLGYENQSTIQSFELYRKAVTINAGYFDEVEVIKGQIIPIPKSLSFDQMSSEVFEKWYNDALNVISLQLDTAPETIRKELDSFY